MISLIKSQKQSVAVRRRYLIVCLEMASLFDTRTLAPLSQITTTLVTQLTDLQPGVKQLATDSLETMETVWLNQADTSNLSWLGEVVLLISLCLLMIYFL